MSRGFHSAWWQGTAAERGAFPTTLLAVPFFWYETDTRDTYQWDGVAWLSTDVGGGGAANQVAYWTGPSVLAGDAGMTYAAGTDTLSVGNVIVPSLGYVGLGPAAGRLVFEDAVPDEARFEDCGYVGIENILYHIGDADTYLIFSPDFAGFRVGGIDFLYMAEHAAAQDEFEVNPGGVDVDFIVQAVGVTDALVVQGSDGQATLGALGAGAVQSNAAGVISSGALPLTDLASYAQGSIIRGGAADWEAYAHPGAAGRALVSDATDILWTVTPTWQGNHTFKQGIALTGASGINIVTIKGNAAQGLHVVDNLLGGACRYLTFDTTTGAQVVVVNESGYDLDFRVEAVGIPNALFVQGSDGAITVGGPSMTVPDGWWQGIGAAAERIVFDAAGDIVVMGANFGVGVLVTEALIHAQTTSAAVANFLILEGDRNIGDTEVGILFKDRSAVGGGQEVARIWTDRDGATGNFDLVFQAGDQGLGGLQTESIRIQGDTGYVGIGTTPTYQLDVLRSSAATGSIGYAYQLSHTTSGVAAARFGVGERRRLEDAGGTMQTASEVATLWATATAGAESPLWRFTTYPKGVVGPGYGGFWTYTGIAGAGITIVPNGTGDVPSGITAIYRLSESGGGVDGNVVMVTTGNSVDLYDDGTDVCTLTVNADGSVTIVRSAGAAMFDVSLLMCWL